MPQDDPLVFAVVEDDESMRRLIVSLVRAAGDIAIEAADFASATVLLGEYPWDVAIIDLTLPDGEGIELCERFEPSPDSHRAVIILSVRGSSEDRTDGFDAGADEYVVKPFAPAELRSRLRAIGRRVRGQKMLQARLASLEQMSMIDGMTRVYNHRFFETELRRVHQTAVAHKRPLSLIMMDIDFFKSVNDTYGHRAGDRVLVEVSTVVASVIRPSDILSRYGGEEFTVILPETELGEALLVAEDIRRAVEASVVDAGMQELRVTVSCGVADLTVPGCDSPGGFVEAADRALYAAKEAGRNRVVAVQKATTLPVIDAPTPQRSAGTPRIEPRISVP